MREPQKLRLKADTFQMALRKIAKGCGVTDEKAAILALLSTEELEHMVSDPAMKLMFLSTCGTALSVLDRINPRNDEERQKFADLKAMYDTDKPDPAIMKKIEELKKEAKYE